MHTFGVGKVHFADILAGARTRLHLGYVVRLSSLLFSCAV